MGVTGETGASVMKGFGPGFSSAKGATMLFKGLQQPRTRLAGRRWPGKCTSFMLRVLRPRFEGLLHTENLVKGCSVCHHLVTGAGGLLMYLMLLQAGRLSVGALQ